MYPEDIHDLGLQPQHVHFGEVLLTFLVFEGKLKTNVVTCRMLRMEKLPQIFSAEFLCLLRFK